MKMQEKKKIKHTYVSEDENRPGGILSIDNNDDHL